ncbi:MAG: GTPase HflX [Burkholderiales bacterium]|nr:GTPase HflX [Burkholderiales bacterium]
MIDRPQDGDQESSSKPSSDKAVLVALDFGEPDAEESLEELRRLTESAGVSVQAVVQGKRSRPDAALFAGSGKVDEVGQALRDTHSGVAIFNHDLSPAQQRNLEQRLQSRVVDRTSLILDIFAQRAQSHEGKVQVELAQLERLSTRLVRGWTHLERQKGGVGLRGPGETQLETDRRLIGKRVKSLKEKLVKLTRQRHTQRRARTKNAVLSVSLVGYTNAGKSTLFNRLTHAGAYVADQLFATLDTTSRRVFLPEAGQLVLSDTVGFIKQLPHGLVVSFRATLEEAARADLLLHVVDASSAARDSQIEQVNSVLTEIGAAQSPQILVMNKIDAAGLPPRVERDEYGKISRVWISAASGDGLDLVRLALVEFAKETLESTTQPVALTA